MKIWVIGRSYPEPGNNMMGSFELEQAKMLRKNGEDVHYLCCSLHPTRVIKKRGYQRWEEDGVIVHSYSKRFFPHVYPFYFMRLRNNCWKKFFQQVYKETGLPDVIHVHYPAMLMLADVLREYQQLGSKIIVTEHWTKVLSKSLDRTELREFRKYFSYIDVCICVGPPLANVVRETVGSTQTAIVVVPNVVEQEFKPVYEKHKDFEFIAVGRLVKIKQFDRIIQTFAKCFRGEPVRLTIVGGGEEQSNLQKQIVSLSMDKQVTLTGSLPRKQVAEFVGNADCLVCFSRFETFGVPIIEAWACGIPSIVSTAAAVTTGKLDSRLGVEVSYEKMKELEDAMRYIYTHTNDYDKKYISDYAQRHYSESTVAGELTRIYQSGLS